MNFYEYYQNLSRSNVRPSQSLEESKNNILNRLNGRATSEDCEKLQNFFNHAFYPEKYGQGNGSQYYNKVIKAVEAAYQQQYDKVLNNFSMGSTQVTYGVEPDELPKLIREKYEDFTHKEKIYISTLQSRLEKVKKLLNDIDINNADENIKIIERDLNSLKNNLNELLEIKDVSLDNKNQAYLDLQKNKDIFQKVEIIDNLYQSLSQSGGIFRPQDYGQILEWVLQAFDASKEPLIDEISEDLIEKEFIEKMTKTAGSLTTGQSTLNFSTPTIQFDDKFVKKKTKKGEKTKVEVKGNKGSFKFEHTSGFKPDSDRQGKMDVEFTFNNNGKYIPFRISAKNWKYLSGHDFGHTTLVYALLRTLGESITEDYIYIMQDENNADIVKQGHDLAKYSILADILIGYSQKNNYADTILINDRQGKQVIVISLIDLMEKIYQKIRKQEIKGYQDNQIHKNMIIMRQAVENQRKKGRSKAYKNLAFKYMQSIQVSIHFENISQYIKY